MGRSYSNIFKKFFYLNQFSVNFNLGSSKALMLVLNRH